MPDFHPRFVISSHVSSVSRCASKLVNSLLKCGIDARDILVVVGGSEAAFKDVRQGVEYAYVMHNSYDHTGLIYLTESEQDHPWWWAMHDTTEAGPEFYQKILAFGPKRPHVAVGGEGWLNMGLFSLSFLQEARHYVLSLKNCSKLRAILSERVYSNLTRSASYAPKDGFTFLDHRDVYGDGVIRRVIYYPALDLYKYQSFYLEKQQTMDYLKSQELERKFHRELPR
jgi:hypothetical protein